MLLLFVFGVGVVMLFEFVSVYSVFVNGGMWMELCLILLVK